MTSLIFGTTYMIHQGIVKHRQDKQRKINYERWEGLRDDYDEQKRISRTTSTAEQASRTSLNLDRHESPTSVSNNSDRGIFTLRDQQEADDARMSWRPQEAWDYFPPSSPAGSAAVSRQPTRALSRQKTGSTWDEDLPARLNVSRRTWGDDEDNHYGNTARNSIDEGTRERKTLQGSGLSRVRSNSVPAQPDFHVIESNTPGGPMAELLDKGW